MPILKVLVLPCKLGHFVTDSSCSILRSYIINTFCYWFQFLFQQLTNLTQDESTKSLVIHLVQRILIHLRFFLSPFTTTRRFEIRESGIDITESHTLLLSKGSKIPYHLLHLYKSWIFRKF